MKTLQLTLVVLVAIASPAAAQPRGTVALAAASDLQTALPQLAAGFEKATGIHAALTFGSSGSFFAQIENGAPFDVFLSADAEYPRRLADAGRIDRASLYDYATGRLVIWTRTDSRLDLQQGLALLRDAGVRRIAIADPAIAPYGRAAVAALQTSGIYSTIRAKLVYGETVAQAAQLTESGNADVAMIGHALAAGPALRAAGRFVDVPASTHPPIVQTAGIVSASRRQDNARAFVAYLKSPDARRILEAFGFEVPGTLR